MAGYRWPQFSVDRGLLHMLLYHLVVRRMGAETVVLGARARGYRQSGRQVTLLLDDGREETGDVLVHEGDFGIVSRADAFAFSEFGRGMAAGAVSGVHLVWCVRV